jgi:16S rRNA (guanine(966)-N(2))-methyltransferase RsmD
MRVIAGKFRSRPLSSLRGMDLRPTADRLRETLFNVLSPGDPEGLEGTIWMDLYAGTGAVGIEALSRGAAKVYFVESSSPAASVIQRNLRAIGVESSYELLRQDVKAALCKLEGVPADFVFLDPPYHMEKMYQQTLEQLSHSQILKPVTIVIAEHQKKFDPGHGFAALTRYRKLEQGDAALSFYRRSA